VDTERPSLTVPEPDPTGPDRSSGGRWSAGFVLTGILAGLAGAGIVAGILLASGARVEKHVTSVVTEQSQSSAAELEPAAVYAEAAPGVVDITARIVTVVQTPVGPRSESGVSIGAGSVISRKGDVVTAEHVVKGARSVTVKLQNGTVRKAKILGRDPATDIAVLKIDPSGLRLHPVELGSSKSLRIGDPIFAIGDPFGYDRSLSGGLVSALDRTIVAPNGFNVAHAIQTDTALNPGNSGGPLLDAQGRLVGIADQIATGGSAIDTNTGVSFGRPRLSRDRCHGRHPVRGARAEHPGEESCGPGGDQAGRRDRRSRRRQGERGRRPRQRARRPSPRGADHADGPTGLQAAPGRRHPRQAAVERRRQRLGAEGRSVLGRSPKYAKPPMRPRPADEHPLAGVVGNEGDHDGCARKMEPVS